MLVRMLRKENTFALLVGMQTGAATVENSMEVPKKIKNRATQWLSNCTIRYVSKGYKSADSKGHMHPNVYSSTIDNSQSMERTQMSIDWWMGEDVVYIYNGVLIGKQKEWNLATCNYMDGTRGYYAKQNSSVRERQISYDLIHIWNLRYKTEEHKGRGAKII